MYGCESLSVKKKNLSTEESMLLSCGVEENSWDSLRLQGDPTSLSESKSILNIHWKNWCWLKPQYFGPWGEELTYLKRPLCFKGLKAGGEGDDRCWDGWMASPTLWTSVWVSSRSCWWTGKSAMMQSMGLQGIGQKIRPLKIVRAYPLILASSSSETITGVKDCS